MGAENRSCLRSSLRRRLTTAIHTISFAWRGNYAASSEWLFTAMQMLRTQLEPEGVLFHCFGASVDAYPSAMAFDMGPAMIVCRTKLGQQALEKDLVNIFESDESIIYGTVQEQEAFHQAWIDGFLRRSGRTTTP